MKYGRIQVAVADGQGGGIGKASVEHFKQACPDIAIIALGINAVATANMIKGDANGGAIGENMVTFNVAKMYVLAGPIKILMPNGLLRELTSKMTEAIGISDVVETAIPSRQCNIRLADGTSRDIKLHLEAAAQISEEKIRVLERLQEGQRQRGRSKSI